jgi:tetrahydromethanopterin S-methyltransferase subunit D
MKIFTKFNAFVLLAFSLTSLLVAQTVPLLPYGVIPVNLTDSTAIDTGTLSVGQMYGILTGTPTGAATYTTPTATAMCAMFPFLNTSSSQGWNYDWYVKNTSLGANTITLAGGTGVTLRGTGTATQNNVRHFKVVFKSCGTTPTVDLVSLELGAF